VKVHERRKSRLSKAWIVGILMSLPSGTAGLTSASCVTEINRVVKTPRGRVKAPPGQPVSGAKIEVIPSSENTIFTTKSARNGSFLLKVKPGKYRVEITADEYLRFDYVVDLRSGASGEPFDVSLQSINQCHDIRITTGPDTEEDRCGSELLPPSLILGVHTIISGQVKDETGAPFKYLEIELKKLSDSVLQPARLDTKTDADGLFKFDEAEPGMYRLLASPNRGFAPPEKLDCYAARNCKLAIVLKTNPTDQPYASCPVQ